MVNKNQGYSMQNYNFVPYEWRNIKPQEELRVLNEIITDLKKQPVNKQELLLRRRYLLRKYTFYPSTEHISGTQSPDNRSLKKFQNLKQPELKERPKSVWEVTREVGNQYSLQNRQKLQNFSCQYDEPKLSQKFSIYKMAQDVGNEYSKRNQYWFETQKVLKEHQTTSLEANQHPEAKDQNQPRNRHEYARQLGIEWSRLARAKLSSAGSTRSKTSDGDSVESDLKNPEALHMLNRRINFGNYYSLRNRKKALEERREELGQLDKFKEEYEYCRKVCEEHEEKYRLKKSEEDLTDTETEVEDNNQYVDHSQLKNKILKEHELKNLNYSYNSKASSSGQSFTKPVAIKSSNFNHAWPQSTLAYQVTIHDRPGSFKMKTDEIQQKLQDIILTKDTKSMEADVLYLKNIEALNQEVVTPQASRTLATNSTSLESPSLAKSTDLIARRSVQVAEYLKQNDSVDSDDDYLQRADESIRTPVGKDKYPLNPNRFKELLKRFSP